MKKLILAASFLCLTCTVAEAKKSIKTAQGDMEKGITKTPGSMDPDRKSTGSGTGTDRTSSSTAGDSSTSTDSVSGAGTTSHTDSGVPTGSAAGGPSNTDTSNTDTSNSASGSNDTNDSVSGSGSADRFTVCRLPNGTTYQLKDSSDSSRCSELNGTTMESTPGDKNLPALK